MRLDQYLFQKQYFDSRNKAASAVKCGYFTINGRIITKPSYEVNDNDDIKRIVEQTNYVARSAHKLLTAFEQFDLNWEDKVAADFGASTGGFCQVLLEKGIKRVYAVDVGSAQLHPKLLEEARIINMEHTNARYLNSASFPDAIDCITADLSFISIKAILPAIYASLKDEGEAVVLIKPQFEVGPAALNKNGVVTDRKYHLSIVKECALFSQQLGFGIFGISFSGLPGESGNREYLLFIKKKTTSALNIEKASYDAVYSEA